MCTCVCMWAWVCRDVVWEARGWEGDAGGITRGWRLEGRKRPRWLEGAQRLGMTAPLIFSRPSAPLPAPPHPLLPHHECNPAPPNTHTTQLVAQLSAARVSLGRLRDFLAAESADPAPPLPAAQPGGWGAVGCGVGLGVRRISVLHTCDVITLLST